MIKKKYPKLKFLRYLLLLTLGGTVACSSMKPKQYQVAMFGANPTEAMEKEKKLSERVLMELKKDYPLVDDQNIQNYVKTLGNHLLQANDLIGQPYAYEFFVVEGMSANSFHVPGGLVFITLPTLTCVKNERDLALILAHEIAHTQEYHTARRLQRAEEARNLWYGRGAGVIGGVVNFGVGQSLCADKSGKCSEDDANKIKTPPKLMAEKYPFMTNTQAEELVADQMAAQIMGKSDYSNKDLFAFYQNIVIRSTGKDSRRVKDFIDNHPVSTERMEQLHSLDIQNDTKSIKKSNYDFKNIYRRAEIILKKKG